MFTVRSNLASQFIKSPPVYSNINVNVNAKSKKVIAATRQSGIYNLKLLFKKNNSL